MGSLLPPHKKYIKKNVTEHIDNAFGRFVCTVLDILINQTE